MSGSAILVGFLMLCLKRCVVPTLPHETIAIETIYSTVLLVYGQPLGLLPIMVSIL